MGKIREIVKKATSENSELDDIIKELEKDEIRRAKLARLREYRLESESRVKELEKRLKSGEENTSTQLSVSDVEAAKMISELPEDQRRKVLAILAALRSAGRSEPSSMLVPLIIASMMSNPSANKEETASIVVKTLESVSKMMKEAREEASKGKESDVGAILSGVAKLIETLKPQEPRTSEFEKKFMEAAIEYFTSPPKSWIDDLISDSKKMEILQKLFGKTDVETLKLLREMKRDDREFQMALKKLDLDTKLKLLALREEARKREAISSGLKKIIKAATEALGEEEISEEEKGKIEERIIEGKASKRATSKLMEITCENCGETFKAAPDTKKIICPKCGAEYQRAVE